MLPPLSSRIESAARLAPDDFLYSFGRIDPMALMMASAAWRSSAMSSEPSVVRIERTPSAPTSITDRADMDFRRHQGRGLVLTHHRQPVLRRTTVAQAAFHFKWPSRLADP